MNLALSVDIQMTVRSDKRVLNVGGRYYGDDAYYYDTAQRVFGRLGKVLYGVGTGSWMTNGSHLLGFGGEPRHQWNMNAESVVQVARVTLRDDGDMERQE